MDYRLILEALRNHARNNHDPKLIDFADLLIEWYMDKDNERLEARLYTHPRAHDGVEYLNAEITRVQLNIARRDAALI